MAYTPLPYDFDLLHDIKSVEDLHDMLINDTLGPFSEQGEIEMLMDKHNIPFPEGYQRRVKKGFPAIVWVDGNGGYLDYQPLPEENHKYQMMKVF